jgi:hypothetical protein
MRKSLATFTLLLAGAAADLAGQSLPPAQPFTMTYNVQNQTAAHVWFQSNTATGQLYAITTGWTTGIIIRATVNGASLLAPTDPIIPGRFVLSAGTATDWALLDQQTGATWIVTMQIQTGVPTGPGFSFLAVPTP